MTDVELHCVVKVFLLFFLYICPSANGSAARPRARVPPSRAGACALPGSECPIQDGRVGGEGEAEAGPDRIERSLHGTPRKALRGKA